MSLFSKSVETSVIIDAPADEVWGVVGALEKYGRWNRATRFQRPAEAGRIRLMMVKLGLFWLPVPVLIHYCNIRQGLRWTGGLSGVITGSHYFRVEPVGNNQSRLVQGEDFAGLLVPILLPLLAPPLQVLYDSINADVSREVVRR